jgi:cytochrome P450
MSGEAIIVGSFLKQASGAGQKHPERSPFGASVTLDALTHDPYPIYARLQAEEPVSWIPALKMWYVTRYEDVRAILMDDGGFTTAWPHSLIFDTFGAQMLTTEGSEHDRYRRPVQPSFSPSHLREHLQASIHECCRALINGLRSGRTADLRASFAARLPVQTILLALGLPLDAESHMRRWYDSFERALSNFSGSEPVRAEALKNVAECHEFLSGYMQRAAEEGGNGSLLGKLVNASTPQRLTDAEIRRNLLIIMFGGVSTVEALILNALWALFTHPEILDRVRREPMLMGRVIEETLRWLSPVQSATRHVTRDVIFNGVQFEQGDVVNCMLGAANRDTGQFPHPDVFDIDRPNSHRHIAFATGVHGCLGFNLAKSEACVGLQLLLQELHGLRLAPDAHAVPEGYEFRQPRSMQVEWS